MHVRVVESGHHEMSAEIDDLRVAALQLADVIVRADGNDATIAHRHRLRARGRRLRIDVAVDEDDVRRIAGGNAAASAALPKETIARSMISR